MAATEVPAQSHRKVIIASSLGTVFEWYDFYLYGLLATIISAQFFSGVNDTTAFILALGAFAAGFAVRPFGALVAFAGDAAEGAVKAGGAGAYAVQQQHQTGGKAKQGGRHVHVERGEPQIRGKQVALLVCFLEDKGMRRAHVEVRE